MVNKMVFVNIECPICGSLFSVVIDGENCSSKECPKCKSKIEVKIEE